MTIENMMDPRRKSDLRRRLLDWYDASARDLPWRVRQGLADPYRVWLSEIMLQQTTVPAVMPYFARFVARWPDVAALAAAPLDDVLAAWAGLGYYARARNLHRCAQQVVRDHGGQFPPSEDGLLGLPGIGPYTAAAIAAIAFGQPAMPVDGNIERVTARLFAHVEPLPKAKPELRRLAQSLGGAERPGDFAQALMDLGATICTPRAPLCHDCPISRHCEARDRGIAASLPARLAKAERPTRHGVAFLLVSGDQVLLRRRDDKGLLGGMIEVPSSEWRAASLDHKARKAALPFKANWRFADAPVEHVFTHFRLLLELAMAEVNAAERMTMAKHLGGTWHRRRDLHALALPSVFTKVLRAAGVKGVR